ncbi:unnamed protein product [Meloidogyne enterolobii]|uniref:Uncharacterized protein n=1 Tax=Meloidogyne enterolobii TaxID=390850 RepID=A0ACB1AZG2_MELEN
MGGCLLLEGAYYERRLTIGGCLLLEVAYYWRGLTMKGGLLEGLNTLGRT